MAQIRPLQNLLEVDFQDGADAALLSPIWSTLSALRSIIGPNLDKPWLNFAFPRLTLIASDALSSNTEISSENLPFLKYLEYTESLVRAAASAAVRNACSSVLAGHSTESDEFGDVGLLIDSKLLSVTEDDDSPRSRSRAILSALGLDALLKAQGGQIIPLDLADQTLLPASFRTPLGDPNVKLLTDELRRLKNVFAFSFDCSVAANGLVFHVLLGQLPEGTNDGAYWAGILGVGIWSG